MLKALKHPLRGYRAAKFFRSFGPKAAYLLIAFVIFELGGSALEDSVVVWSLKIVLVTGLWALQQFFIEPFFERRFRAYKQKKLKETIYQFCFLSAWAIATKAELEYSLEEGLKEDREK